MIYRHLLALPCQAAGGPKGKGEERTRLRCLQELQRPRVKSMETKAQSKRQINPLPDICVNVVLRPTNIQGASVRKKLSENLWLPGEEEESRREKQNSIRH